MGRITRLAFLMLVGSTMACGLDKDGVGVAIDPADLFQRVELEYRTYNVSQLIPYDTVTIKVRGVSGTGATIDAPVTWGYNSRYVTVSPDGFLRAVAPVSSTPVTVTMTYNGATRVDTAFVSVISGEPQQLDRLAIEVNPGDSAKTTVSGIVRLPLKTLRLVRANTAGTNNSSLLVTLRSSDTATAKITQSGNNVTVTPVRPGRVTFYVSTYAYGVKKSDSLTFIVGWPLGAFIGSYSRYKSGTNDLMLDFKGSNLTLGVGACVVWSNANDALDLDVVFDDSSNVAPPDSTFSGNVAQCKSWAQQDTISAGIFQRGNISPWGKRYLSNGGQDIYSQMRARSFPRAGVYRFHSALHGSGGIITVCDEKNDPTCAPENYQWGVIDP